VVARLLARLAQHWQPERERAARRNLAVLRPRWAPAARAAAARGASTAYARFLLEYLRLHDRAPSAVSRLVAFDLDAGSEAALSGGRGLVVCTAHVGNWEVGAQALAARGARVAVVAGAQFAPGWRRAVARAKARAGIQIVGPGESPRRLLRVLAEGGAVCLLVDGDLYARGWPARVAGCRISLPSGPARLAARSGAALVGSLCLRAGFGFRVEMRCLGATADGPVADALLLHAAVAAWLEAALERHATEWCVFRPFFEDGAA
jgi:KDO2-lipid IV(A) lauroyltransferase